MIVYGSVLDSRHICKIIIFDLLSTKIILPPVFDRDMHQNTEYIYTYLHKNLMIIVMYPWTTFVFLSFPATFCINIFRSF